MEIKFDFTRKDYWNFTRYSILHIPIVRNTMIGMLTIIFILLLTTIDFNFTDSIIVNFILFISNLIIFGIILLISYFLMKLFTMKLPAKKPGVIGEHVIRISEEGLRESTSVNNSLHKWSGVFKILTNDSYIFIFLDNMVAHVIPKSAFPSKSEAEEFHRLAIFLWDNNK